MNNIRYQSSARYWAYLAAFGRARVVPKELYPANGKVLGKDGNWSALATLRAHTLHGKDLGYEGVSLAGTKLR